MGHATDHVILALKAARETRAVSQRELSAKAGVPQAQISRLESGAVDIRLSSLVSLARALDLEVQLIPRRAVAAVETVVRATTRAENKDKNTRATGAEITQLAKALQGLRSREIPPVAIAKVLSHLRILERVQPIPEQMDAIRKFNRLLAYKKRTIDPDVFARHAKAIEHIRNQVAHAPPPALPPRPAYSLEEDEDDA